MKRFVRRRFGGQLLLDFAHFRQAKDAIYACGVGAVFGRQVA